jgi:hypothetical protein
MRAALLVFATLGSFFQLPATVIFPTAPVPTDPDGTCILPLPYNAHQASVDLAGLHATIFLRTDTGNASVVGLPQLGSFLISSPLPSGVATPSGVGIPVGIDPSMLAYGHNKAYVGFFVGTSSTYAGFVTIDVNCSPQATVSVVPSTISATLPQGSPPVALTMLAKLQGANQGAGNYVKNPIPFIMTPTVEGQVTPWITSASVPGSPAGAGTVPAGGAQNLTVNVNPLGLLAQSTPYEGFVHIVDSSTGIGAADLTVHLSIAGNFTLPHFAANGVLATGFYIVNNSVAAATYILSFYDDNGKPVALPIPGQGNQPSVTGTLQANGSAYIEVGDPSQPQVGGSVRITGDPTIGVQSLFRIHYQNSPLGNRFYEAAVPATVGSKEFLTPFDATMFAPTNDQTFTGIAIANLDSGTTSVVTCVARDSSGNVIPNAVTVPALPPLGHWAGFNFPALLGTRGTLDCTGTTTIGAIALHSYSTSGAITSLPVILK